MYIYSLSLGISSLEGLILKLVLQHQCYELKSLEWDNRITLVLSNTRELNRVPSTKWSTLYTTTHGPCSLLCTLP